MIVDVRGYFRGIRNKIKEYFYEVGEEEKRTEECLERIRHQREMDGSPSGIDEKHYDDRKSCEETEVLGVFYETLIPFRVLWRHHPHLHISQDHRHSA